jgi:hypothetical protein
MFKEKNRNMVWLEITRRHGDIVLLGIKGRNYRGKISLGVRRSYESMVL